MKRYFAIILIISVLGCASEEPEDFTENNLYLIGYKYSAEASEMQEVCGTMRTGEYRELKWSIEYELVNLPPTGLGREASCYLIIGEDEYSKSRVSLKLENGRGWFHYYTFTNELNDLATIDPFVTNYMTVCCDDVCKLITMYRDCVDGNSTMYMDQFFS